MNKSIINIVSCILLFFSTEIKAQDYSILKPGVKKAFLCEQTKYIYSWQVQDSIIIGTDSVFNLFMATGGYVFYPSYTYMNILGSGSEDSCYSWGGCFPGGCSFMGNHFVKQAHLDYVFFNYDSSQLHFNFNLIINDSSIVYSDASNNLFIKYVGIIQDTLYDLADSFRIYKFSHLNGTMSPIITSPVHDFQILLGKQSGLNTFINPYLFPDSLQTLNCIGSTQNNFGLLALTDSSIYDYEIGDEFQYKIYNYYSPPVGYPGSSYSSTYQKNTVLNKFPLPNGFTYELARESFPSTGLIVTYDTVSVSYFSNDTIVDIPFERVINYTRNLSYKTFCDTSRLYFHYGYTNEFSICEDEKLLCGVDLFPGIYKTNGRYAKGLGLYSGDTVFQSSPSAPSASYTGNGRYIVYYKKNGVVCGSQALVGMFESEKPNIFSFFPNPANNSITLKMEAEYGNSTHFILTDLAGKQLFETTITEQLQTILLPSNLTNGMYFIQIKSKNYSATKSLVIQK